MFVTLFGPWDTSWGPGSLPLTHRLLSMNIDQELGGFTPDRESVLTIGVFDGVHRGHRRLISHLMEEAGRIGLLAGVVTFRNHPASVLQHDFEPRYLTTLDERVGLMAAMGTDFIVPISFDLELSKLRARQFATLLRQHLRMRGLVVGPDFAMGHRREGDVDTLRSLGREMGFSLYVVESYLNEDGQAVKSTTIREALSRGNVASVSSLLGRNFALTGKVVRGQGRGGPLGFPTANLDVPQGMAVPGDGIYAAWAHIGPQRYMSATSIGVRPTFGGGENTIEAFVLGFEGDLYDQQIRLEFVGRLRDEVKFDSVRALQEQVNRDVDQARAALQSG